MATLAPSLKAIFNELDRVWPKRDRRTDGWYRNCTWVDHGTDHCPTRAGVVHAIDIDKDGINADHVVSILIQYDGVVRYVIWNRHIWQAKNGWKKENYTGTSNPHTDHIHVSIQHTYNAEHWPGPFGFGSSGGGSGTSVQTALDNGSAWDFSAHVDNSGKQFTGIAKALYTHIQAIRGLRK